MAKRTSTTTIDGDVLRRKSVFHNDSRGHSSGASAGDPSLLGVFRCCRFHRLRCWFSPAAFHEMNMESKVCAARNDAHTASNSATCPCHGYAASGPTQSTTLFMISARPSATTVATRECAHCSVRWICSRSNSIQARTRLSRAWGGSRRVWPPLRAREGNDDMVPGFASEGNEDVVPGFAGAQIDRVQSYVCPSGIPWQ
ncbi:hypothetical protein BC828DRAFT_375245 [Blastocladiella britannica]|nr:hypothetical protein BC828DRAFT_375245 [Blastocladiella britannica]